jgi:MFS family permease
LFASSAVTLLITVPLAVWLCRRLGAVWVLRLGAAGLAVTQLLYAQATATWELFAARGVQGAAGGVAWVAGLALIAAAYPAGRRGWALGIAMTGASLGTLVGPPLGGILFAWGGLRCPFYAASAWTLLLTFLTFLLPRRFGRLSRTPPSLFPAGGWQIYARPLLVIALGATFLSALEPTLPVQLEERLGAGPAQVGLLFGLAALAYGAISPLAGWWSDRRGPRRVVVAGLCGCAATLPLLALPRTYAGEMAALALFGAACALLLTPTMNKLASLAERQKPPEFALAYSAFNLAYALGLVVGPVSAGLATPRLGFAVTSLCLGALSLFALLASVRPWSQSSVISDQ